MANVFIVNSEHRADYKVFFVDSVHREQNAQIITDCKLVAQESRADLKVFIVNSEHRANIQIMRKHFPK